MAHQGESKTCKMCCEEIAAAAKKCPHCLHWQYRLSTLMYHPFFVALFPAATADFFGNKNVGLNYGWVFSSYGVGGIVGPILAGRFGQMAKGGDPSAWLAPFVIAGAACLLAAALALMLQPPKRAS